MKRAEGSNDSGGHQNPVDESDVTDWERAEMLSEYLRRFKDEFGEPPKLMPLDESGKAPIIQGRCSLDSDEGRSLLVTAEEAVRQIREEGTRGFAIYAGKETHNTSEAAFIDHDDSEAFPAPTGGPTLEVLSGSGRGSHETYRNAAGDPVSNARVGSDEGEVRANNWYVIAPGSIHPSGGVYHITEDRPIAALSDDDLTDRMRPASVSDGADIDYTPKNGSDESHAREVAKHYSNIQDYLSFGSGDRSESDFHVCCRMIEHGVSESEVYRLLANNSNSKVDARDASSDYWQRTWQKAKRQVGTDAGTETLSAHTDGGTATVAPTATDTLPSPGGDPWDSVYHHYATADDAEERKPARYEATELLSEAQHWANLEENDQLYAYESDRGIYQPNGEKKVRHLLVENLKEQYAKNEKSEILDQLRGRHTVSQDEMGGPADHIPVRNGVLEIKTHDVTLKEHSPEYRFIGAVEAEYDPDAKCPQFRRFLNDVVQSGAGCKKLQEYAGYTLMHWGLPHHKALFLVGPTASGKSTFLDTIRAVLGTETVVSLTPQELTGERFAGAELFQSWANFRNDIPSQLIEDTGAFKEITAGDSIKAERKFKDPFRFEPTAKHLFSANQLPDAETEDEAFYRRVLLVPFPSTVPEDQRDEHLDDKLQSELSGVLNWMLEGLQRLMQQGKFTADRTPGETQRTWEKWGNTVDRFRESCLERVEGEAVPKKTAYRAYHAYCEAENLPAETQHKMTRRLKSEGIADGRTYVDGEQQRCFVGVQLSDRGNQYLTDSKGGDSDTTSGTGLGSFGDDDE